MLMRLENLWFWEIFQQPFEENIICRIFQTKYFAKRKRSNTYKKQCHCYNYEILCYIIIQYRNRISFKWSKLFYGSYFNHFESMREEKRYEHELQEKKIQLLIYLVNLLILKKK